MYVYELRRCEEYFMQESHGLFETADRAAKDATGTILLDCTAPDGFRIVVTVSEGHYANPDTTRVVTKTGLVVDCQNIWTAIQGYDFYDIIHAGYDVWGIVQRAVIADTGSL